ncbi:MAG TPA: hypothetical protein PK406_00735 [Verrucomicrobiota bacterium]|nr:hypothetical protein [Verrucomicrobiota bacterium]
MTTASLPVFFSRVCGKLPVVLSQLGDPPEQVDYTLSGGNDREILRAFREETALIVVKVRLLNEARKEEMKVKWAEWREKNDVQE